MTYVEYVIIDSEYRFAIHHGKANFSWSREYPDATLWANYSEAKKAFHALTRRGHCANVYSLIRNYGLETQETIARFDGLA